MAKVKTYWDEIKDDEVNFYGGSMGWEVRLMWVDCYQWNSNKRASIKKRRLELQWPWGYGGQEKLPKGEKAQTRKDVLLQKKIRKLLAQASTNYSEYRDLNSRTHNFTDEDWGELFNLGLKGFELGNWIRRQHLTYGEAHALFWRM